MIKKKHFWLSLYCTQFFIYFTILEIMLKCLKGRRKKLTFDQFSVHAPFKQASLFLIWKLRKAEVLT